MRCAERARHAVGQVRGCQMLHVFALRQADVPVASGDVDVEQVGNWSFIFNVPMSRQVVDEAGIERPFAVVRVECEQVVDIASQDDALRDVVDRLLGGENTGGRGALCEAPFAQPGKERALPSSPGLRHAVDGLLDTTDARAAVRSVGGVAGVSVAVHDLTLLQLALQ
eukprot:6161830-Pleurochrysis_carterae.AAC.2